MKFAAMILTGLVAVEHVGILVLEMFLGSSVWTKGVWDDAGGLGGVGYTGRQSRVI